MYGQNVAETSGLQTLINRSTASGSPGSILSGARPGDKHSISPLDNSTGHWDGNQWLGNHYLTLFLLGISCLSSAITLKMTLFSKF